MDSRRWALAAGVLICAGIAAGATYSMPLAGVGIAGVFVVVVAATRPELLHRTALLLGLAASTGAAAGIIEGGYSPLRGIALGVAVLLAVARPGRTLRLLGRETWLLLLLGWATVSLAWVEQETTESALFLATLVGALLLGVGLAAYQTTEQAGNLIAGTLATLAAASALLILFVPAIGTVETVRPGEGIVTRLSGIFPWNSDLGLVAGLLAVIAATSWFQSRRKRHLVLAAAAFALTLASESATSIVATTAAIAVVVWFASRRARKLLAFAAVGIALVAISGQAEQLIDQLLISVGRSADLTGRAVIWPYVIESALQRPLGGYGVGAGPNLSNDFGFNLTHAHNGYLQLFLELGFVGTILFAGSLIATAVRVLRSGNALLAGILAIFVLSNFANNYLMSAGVAMVLYGWLTFSSLRPHGPSLASPTAAQTVAAG